jgi:hypothetical protein
MQPKKSFYSTHVEHKLNDKLHREDGPAIEWHDGAKLWYIAGILHRRDGPAVDNFDGEYRWYFCGKLLNRDNASSRAYKDFLLLTNYVKCHAAYMRNKYAA